MLSPPGGPDSQHFQTSTYLDNLTPLFKPRVTCEKRNKMTVPLVTFKFSFRDSGLFFVKCKASDNAQFLFCHLLTDWKCSSLTQHQTSGVSNKQTNMLSLGVRLCVSSLHPDFLSFSILIKRNIHFMKSRTS